MHESIYKLYYSYIRRHIYALHKNDVPLTPIASECIVRFISKGKSLRTRGEVGVNNF